jgi:hypothetical protein
MEEFDRLTFESWSVAFPREWIDHTQEDGSLYFEAPDGSKGFYAALWSVEAEQRTPLELVQVFQETELEAFLPESEGWILLDRGAGPALESAHGYWRGYNAANEYYISGRQIAAGGLVLRATFHDYASSYPDASAEYFEPIIGSLTLGRA